MEQGEPTAPSDGNAPKQKQNAKQKQQQQQQKGKGNKKPRTVEQQLVLDIRRAAKDSDLPAGIAAFRQAQQAGAKLTADALAPLLYLLAGGDSWEAMARGALPDAAAADNVRTATTGPAPADVPPPDATALEAVLAAFAQQQREREQREREQGQQDEQGGKEQGEGGAGQASDGAAAAAQEGEEERREPPRWVPGEERVAVAGEVWASIQASGAKVNAAVYLSLARLEGIARRPDKALALAREAIEKCSGQGSAVPERNFHPALVGFCMRRDAGGALGVLALIDQQKLDPSEYAYARVVEALASSSSSSLAQQEDAGASSWSRLQEALLRMGQELTELSPSTADLLRAYFTSPQSHAALPAALPPAAPPPSSPPAHQDPEALQAAAAAAPEGGEQAAKRRKLQAQEGQQQRLRWQVDVVKVERSGACAAAGGRLRVSNLREDEWAAFADAVASLVRKNERKGNPRDDFDAFVKWHDEHGPFDVVIDGANVAFSGRSKNFDEANFSWAQIRAMHAQVTSRHPGAKVLLVLHRKRLENDLARCPRVQAFLAQLRQQNAFYACPKGSNDDWYWLWACVRAKCKGLLVSNDELRDHIFRLLRPRHFLRWRQHHVAQYTFKPYWEDQGLGTAEGMAPPPWIIYPPAYTTCVQRLEESGAWMVPCAGSGAGEAAEGADGGGGGTTWLCARPVPVDAGDA